MLHDLGTLLWLRARHAHAQLVFWVYATGADLEDSKSLFDKLYLAYLVLLACSWAVAMWSIVTAEVSDVFVQLSRTDVELLIRIAVATPLVASAVRCMKALRSSPLKLTSPDIAYLGASSIGSMALFGTDALSESIRSSALGCLLGYFLGVGMAAAGTGAFPAHTALIGGILAAVVVLGGWVVGTARLAGSRPMRRWLLLATWSALAAIAFLEFGGTGVSVWPLGVVATSLTGGGISGHAVVLGAIVLLGVLLLAWLSRRADMTAVIDESGLYAEERPLRLLRRFDPGAYREILRRKRLARMKPRFRLPLGEGWLAPISRALVSYLRQPGRLVTLFVWGGLVVPAGVLLILWRASALLFLPWVSLALTGVSHELTRVFRDDLQCPSLRRVLPFDTLSMLLLDSAPALFIAVVLSVTGVILVHRSGEDLLAGVVLAALINVIAVLCRCIGMLDYPRARRAISSELSMLIALAVIMVVGLTGSPWESAVAAVAVALAAAAVVRLGRE